MGHGDLDKIQTEVYKTKSEQQQPKMAVPLQTKNMIILLVHRVSMDSIDFLLLFSNYNSDVSQTFKYLQYLKLPCKSPKHSCIINCRKWAANNEFI